MKNIVIIGGVIVLVFGFLTPQIAQAQGTIYLSNLGEPSTGSRAVGSNSWLAVPFVKGINDGGYILNSIQLGVADASGNPGGFTVMLYTPNHLYFAYPGNSLGTLSGSADPATGGVYTYSPAGNLTLSEFTEYLIVLTAGTAVANGAYQWSFTSTSSYNQAGRWSIGTFAGPGPFSTSADGSSWSTIPTTYLQLAINATAVPEPGGLSLFVLGGLLLGFGRWKAKAV